MRPVRAAALALGAVAALAAGCAYTTIESYPCPPGGTQLTYANFGERFINGWCQGCHGSAMEHHDGAPADFVFDTVAQVRRHRARIFVRAAAGNDSMPPGPNDPPRAERERLAEWLACGAP